MSTHKFEFADHKVSVEIAGKTYEIDCTTKTGEYIGKQGNVLTELSEKLAQGEKTEADVIDVYTEIIDHLIGKGATAAIFEGREMRTDDMADICVFLASVFHEHTAAHRREVSAKFAQGGKKKK